MRFYTPVTVSQNQAETPEGFLICFGCAIARTGFQDYNETELDVPPGPDGMIRVERDQAEVFHPDTIASAEGKDIVITHPAEDVTPGNWTELARGHMQNVRRGEGVEDDLLLADLVFKHPEAISRIKANPKHELSCGYDARYEVSGPGRASQCQIRINHVALVDQGRCGPICSTKDHLPPDLWTVTTALKHSDTIRPVTCNCGAATSQKTEDGMSKKSWLDRMRDAWSSKDAAAFEAAAKDAAAESESVLKNTGNPEENETHQHIHVHLGGPETTKPEGNLPETGETRVTNAADTARVGGEHEATFGGKTFFTDKATDEAFKHEMKEMKDSIKKIGDSFEEFKKQAADDRKARDDDKARARDDDKARDDKARDDDDKRTKDKVEGEESAHEKANRAIEGELKEEAPPGTSDAHKARDSAFLEDSFAKTISLATILVPTIAIPTFDKALEPAKTYGSICALRRKALSAYAATIDGAAVVAAISPHATLDSMPCRDVAPIFRAAAAMQAQKNNASVQGTQDGSYFTRAAAATPGPKSMEDVQRANDAYWAEQAKANQ